MTQGTLFSIEPVARSRRLDPSSSKHAAASERAAKQDQWRRILKRLTEGPISADTAGQLIGRHRSIASSRLGVMRDRGLVERAGLHVERDENGRERPVLRYRLTPAGVREAAVMFNAGVQ